MESREGGPVGSGDGTGIFSWRGTQFAILVRDFPGIRSVFYPVVMGLRSDLNGHQSSLGTSSFAVVGVVDGETARRCFGLLPRLSYIQESPLIPPNTQGAKDRRSPRDPNVKGHSHTQSPLINHISRGQQRSVVNVRTETAIQLLKFRTTPYSVVFQVNLELASRIRYGWLWSSSGRTRFLPLLQDHEASSPMYQTRHPHGPC